MTVDDQLILRFNLFRENKLGKEFKREEMKKLLKDQLGFPASDQFLTNITSGVNPPIVRVSRGRYTVNSKPVHIDRLKKVIDDYLTCLKESKKGHKKTEKKNLMTSKHENHLIPKEEAIAKAIALLKKEGYRVQRPETKWIEC